MLVLLLCAGALRRATRGRVIIVYMGACSLGMRGYLGSPLRCTGGRCYGYSVWPFMAVIFGLLLMVPVIVLVRIVPTIN